MKYKLIMILAVSILLVGCGNQQEAVNKTESEATHKHSYTESTTKEVTCTEAGEKTFTCKCGDIYTEAIETTGHDYTNDITAPTCTENGYTTHTCKICGDTYTDAEVAATNHNYSGYTYNKDATYEKDGTETATCSACGEKNTRTKTGTKLVKAEPSQPEQTKCPYTLYEITDNWTTITWYYANTDPRAAEFGNQQTAMFLQRHNISFEQMTQKTRWTGYFVNGMEVVEVILGIK